MKYERRKQIKELRKDIMKRNSQRNQEVMELGYLLKELEHSNEGYIAVNRAELDMLTAVDNIQIRGIRFRTCEGVQYIAYIAPHEENDSSSSGEKN